VFASAAVGATRFPPRLWHLLNIGKRDERRHGSPDRDAAAVDFPEHGIALRPVVGQARLAVALGLALPYAAIRIEKLPVVGGGCWR